MQIKKRTFSTSGQNQESLPSQHSEYIKISQDQSPTQCQVIHNVIPKNNSLDSNVQSINTNSNSNQVNNLLYKISILSPIKKHPRNRKNIYSKHNEQNYYEEMVSPLGQQHISQFSNQSSIHNLSLDEGSLVQNKNIQNLNFLESDLSNESNNNSQLFSAAKFDILENRQQSQGKKSEMLSRQRKQIVGKFSNQLPSIQASNNSGELSMIQSRKQSAQNNMQTPQKIQKSNQNNGFKNQQNMNVKKIMPLFNQNTNSTSNNSNVLTQDNDISNQKINNQDKNIIQFSVIDHQNQYNPALYGAKARKLIDLTDQSQQISKNNIRQSSQNSKENSLNASFNNQQFLKSNNSSYKQPQITYQAVYGSENDIIEKQEKTSIHTPVKQIHNFQGDGMSYHESLSQTPEVKSSMRNQTKFERAMESQISQTVSVNKNFDEIKQQINVQSQRQPTNNVYNKNQIFKVNSEQQSAQVKILKNKSNNGQTSSNYQKQQIQAAKQTKNPKQISTEGGGAYSENDTYVQKMKGEQSTGTMTSSGITSKKNSLVLVKQNNRIRNNPKVIRINQIQNMNELFPENSQNMAHSQIVIQDGKIIQKELNVINQKQANQASSSIIKRENNQLNNQQAQNQNEQQNLESNYVTFKDIPVANSCDPTLYRISAQSQMTKQNINENQNNTNAKQSQNIVSSDSTQQPQEKMNLIQNQNDLDIKEDQMRNSGGDMNGIGYTKDEIEYTKDGIEIHKIKNLSSCFSNSALSQCSIQTIGQMNRKKINLTMLVAYGEQLSKLNDIFQEFDVSSSTYYLIDNPIFLQNLLQKCHWFLDIINTEKDLEQLPLLFKDEKSRKIIKQSMIFERCVIVFIAQNLLDKDVFNNNYKYLKGIVHYAYQNYINTISIIHHKMANQLTFSKLNIQSQNQSNIYTLKGSKSDQLQNDQTFAVNNSNLMNNQTISTINNTNTVSTCINQDEKIKQISKNAIEFNEDDEDIDPYTKQQFMKLVRRQSTHITTNSSPQRPQQKWIVTLLNQIRQNNEITINSFKNISKNDKEFYTYILNFIKTIDRGNSVNQIYNSMLQYFSLYLIQRYQQMDTPLHFSIPFLSTAPAPYLPEMDKKYNYTLVLDLDETLIHYTEAYNNVKQFVVRPYVQTFLHQISEFYEIVVFTAGMPDYANWVIDNFDTKGFIKHRLYRQHTLQIQNTFIKDLSRIGRDLSKVIIIDNLAENFQFQPDNGIFIRAWTDDPTDTALAELLPLLKEIAVKKSLDVRVALKILKEQIQKNIEEGIEFPHLNLKL
ncbi:NLI interacting factor-like phosphatase (macronuclear) [Tetrahymena thermophila SB210]|uniref:NLI interacting factor-like phosphatase n=1 Tax=Tetrahymena thermophila (strain SB210) TaxID=312017 RepID=Q22R94_TETTS|nr:NLI interacting factor-like phosphatase [Tetrahymena thermophila SB210]EAR88228.2 NLI interacting factor-like phosphatase [Tetrahymena thermophila SB210]|eukprot:XP_001008473.2 NLI interacting factor-like phosphatase [Tetrahymena thermophila SB210]